MGLRFYDAKLQARPSSPNEYYREQFQAEIDTTWLETTTLNTIRMENYVGDFKFNDIEVRLNHAIEKSTGVKLGDDYREIIFRLMDQIAPKGLYYQFDDSYWLCHNTDQRHRTSKNIMVRRCNNYVRFKDQEDGRIIQYPCIIDYDISSPSPQVDNDIITPNNHVTIWVQGNEETRKLVRNVRLMFGDDVFKITGYNKVLQNGIVDQSTPLYYIDAYLDEKSPYDNEAEGLAYYNPNNYQININQKDFSQISGYSTTLTATVTDNGEIVDREIKWFSSDESVVTIDENGLVNLVGNSGSSAVITCQLGQNEIIKSTLDITIIDVLLDEPNLVIEPIFNSISQGEEIIFDANIYIDNIKQNDNVNILPSGADSKSYKLQILGSNKFKLKCLRVSSTPLILTFIYNSNSEFKAIQLKSMF